MILSIYFIISALTALVIHELGHFITALLLTGNIIKFHFAFGYLIKIPIPRFIWYMPDTSKTKQKIIAMAGFVAEYLFMLLLYAFFTEFAVVYNIFVVIHLIAYGFYAGDSSDFKWL